MPRTRRSFPITRLAGSREPIERQNLGDAVYRRLWRMIVHGELEPGTPVAEEEVAAALGVSRTPVREAMLLLEHEGLLSNRPGHTSLVTPPTLEDIEESYPVIAVLEGLAARLAVPNLTDDDLRRLDEITEAMARYGRQGDTEKLLEADTEFHGLLHERAGNHRLRRLIGKLRRQMERFEYAFFSSPPDLQASLERHRNLVRVLQGRDPDAAQQALERQWDLGREGLSRLFEPPAKKVSRHAKMTVGSKT